MLLERQEINKSKTCKAVRAGKQKLCPTHIRDKKMKKNKLLAVVISLLVTTSVFAEDIRVVVAEPEGNVSEAIRNIVREEFSSIIVNTQGYTLLERALLSGVIEESLLQESLGEDYRSVGLGLLIGADYTLVSVLTTTTDGNIIITSRLVEVTTARTVRQENSRTRSGTGDLRIVASTMAQRMFRSETLTPRQQAQLERELARTQDRLSVSIERSERQIRNGRALAGAGALAPLVGLGVGYLIAEEDISDNRVWIGAAIGGAVGVPLAITGGVMVANGRRHLRRADRLRYASVDATFFEFSFGITNNGNVGLVVNF